MQTHTHTHTKKLAPSNVGSRDIKVIIRSSNQQFQAEQANMTDKELIPIPNKPRERLTVILMVVDQGREKILCIGAGNILCFDFQTET